MGWPEEPAFHRPGGRARPLAPAVPRGARSSNREWRNALETYTAARIPPLAGELEQWLSGELPEGWEEALPAVAPGAGQLATRQAPAWRFRP